MLCTRLLWLCCLLRGLLTWRGPGATGFARRLRVAVGREAGRRRWRPLLRVDGGEAAGVRAAARVSALAVLLPVTLTLLLRTLLMLSLPRIAVLRLVLTIVAALAALAAL